jgi:hypothetical protein
MPPTGLYNKHFIMIRIWIKIVFSISFIKKYAFSAFPIFYNIIFGDNIIRIRAQDDWIALAGVISCRVNRLLLAGSHPWGGLSVRLSQIKRVPWGALLAHISQQNLLAAPSATSIRAACIYIQSTLCKHLCSAHWERDVSIIKLLI